MKRHPLCLAVMMIVLLVLMTVFVGMTPTTAAATDAHYKVVQNTHTTSGDPALHVRTLVLKSTDSKQSGTIRVVHRYQMGQRSVRITLTGCQPADFSPEPYFDAFRHSGGDDDGAMRDVAFVLADLKVGPKRVESEFFAPIVLAVQK